MDKYKTLSVFDGAFLILLLFFIIPFTITAETTTAPP